MIGLATALGLFANLAMAVWVGSIVFFSFVATPVLFHALAREEAGVAVRAIFPSYYRLGAACGAVFVAAMAVRAVLADEPQARSGLETVLGSVMLAATLYGWRVLLPQVERARVRLEGKDPTDHAALEQRHFKRMHTLSVRLNATVMALGLLCLTLRLMAK